MKPVLLDPATTALILIDLQKGIVERDLHPFTGIQVVETCQCLAKKFREADALVICVNVQFSENFADALNQPVDKASPRPSPLEMKSWSILLEGVAEPQDIRITKHQWGAFYGTELDAQLRRRGVTTLVIGGITTNMGVESTARQAWEHGYSVITVKDAMTSLSETMQNFAIENIFPLISRVRLSSEINFSF